MRWSDTFLNLLKDNDIRLIGYVPDNVLTPLIEGISADNYFMPVGATHEDEAIGTVTGAYMAGLRGAVMMQTSRFALIANALASLVLLYQIPAIMVISERGTMGEFNIGQSLVARTMRPTPRHAWHCASHALRRNEHAVHRRFIDQAGLFDASAGRLHPLAALDRRQSRGQSQTEDLRASRVSDDRSLTKMLNRTALTKLLVQKLRHHEAVIGGIGNSNFDLFAAGHRPQNFYMLGSMGLACPIALGTALAQPERGVIALEGDGSILMGLGCLATIANVKPRNLTIIIWDNGIYQITGKQRAATAGATDIVPVARGAGIANSEWVRDEHFEKLIERRFEEGGPVLPAVRIDDEPGREQTPRDPVLIRSRFMKGLGTGRSGALEA
jgi:Thiamine pyrophosphate enzyme, C-terminal TPP binding domain